MQRLASGIWQSLRQYPMLLTSAVISLLLALPTMFSADGITYKLAGFLVILLVVLPCVYSIRDWPELETASPGESLMFAMRMAPYGPFAMWAAMKLRRLMLNEGLFPEPLHEDFLFDLARQIDCDRQQWRYDWKTFNRVLAGNFEALKKRLENPLASVESYSVVDFALKNHGIAPIPPTADAPPSRRPSENLELRDLRKAMRSIIANIENGTPRVRDF